MVEAEDHPDLHLHYMENTRDEDSPTELLEAHFQAWCVSLNYMPSMALRCALQLGIPDIVSNHDGPVTLSELVAQLSIPPAKSCHLHRIMQLLVHLGYFAIKKNDQDKEGYTLTASSKLLVSDNEHPSFASFLLLVSDPVYQTPSFYLADWFRGPQYSSAFEIANGVGYLEYMEKHPDFATASNESLARSSPVETRGLLKELIPKLEGFESLVDVGGGTGAVANIISEAVPHLKCTVLDLPSVISEAKHKDNINITFLAGDMFEFIPSANIYFFKGILPMLSDEQAVKVLSRCCQAVQLEKKGGKVIMVEKVKDQPKPTFESIKLQLSYDISTMNFGGTVRNETEWKQLFVDAGFTSYKITPTISINSIIELFP